MWRISTDYISRSGWVRFPETHWISNSYAISSALSNSGNTLSSAPQTRWANTYLIGSLLPHLFINNRLSLGCCHLLPLSLSCPSGLISIRSVLRRAVALPNSTGRVEWWHSITKKCSHHHLIHLILRYGLGDGLNGCKEGINIRSKPSQLHLESSNINSGARTLQYAKLKCI